MTPERHNLNCVRVAGVLILVIAVWGTLGLHAQNLPETASITGATAIAAPTVPIATPTVEPPATTAAAPTSTAVASAPAAPARAAAPRADGAPIESAHTVEIMVGQSAVLDVGSPITRVS